MTVKFIIPGEPKGKGRPRFSTSGKYPRAYTPKETANYENLVKVIYLEDGNPKFEGAIKARITAYFQPPASASKKKRAAMLIGAEQHTKRPDLDNVIKSVLDGLLGVAYDDDKQVVEIEASKKYGTQAQVVVELTEI